MKEPLITIKVKKSEVIAVSKIVDSISALGGDSIDQDLQSETRKGVKAFDRILKRNLLPRRDFN